MRGQFVRKRTDHDRVKNFDNCIQNLGLVILEKNRTFIHSFVLRYEAEQKKCD